MAKKVKLTPKELKKPDRFREFIAKGVFVVSENYRKILLAFGLIIIALTGALIGTIIHERNKLAVNSLFREAMVSYQKENYEEALSRFLSLKKEYPKADVTKIALFYAALINYNTGKYEEAINLFNDFLKSGVKDQMLKDAAYLNLGTASFDMGNWQQAIDYLSKLDKKNNPYRNQAKLQIALSLEKLGKKREAEAIYKELYKDSANDLKLQVQ
jgi:TolA-binding protein